MLLRLGLAGGVHNDSTGYACKMETLVSAWRAAFNATAEELPFGIVTLAGGIYSPPRYSECIASQSTNTLVL